MHCKNNITTCGAGEKEDSAARYDDRRPLAAPREIKEFAPKQP